MLVVLLLGTWSYVSGVTQTRLDGTTGLLVKLLILVLGSFAYFDNILMSEYFISPISNLNVSNSQNFLSWLFVIKSS